MSKPPSKPLFDTHCYDLAELFLPDDISAFFKTELASVIQTTIEDWLSDYAQAIENDLNGKEAPT